MVYTLYKLNYIKNWKDEQIHGWTSSNLPTKCHKGILEFKLLNLLQTIKKQIKVLTINLLNNNQ